MTQLAQALAPWADAPNIDYGALSDTEWDAMLIQAGRISRISRTWYLAGIRRAIDEMERKIDGKHMWLTRNELIAHLTSINAPN